MVSTKNKFNRWEVSLSVFESSEGRKYKVTRRLSELSVAETKIFDNLNEARELFDEWLN